MRPVKAGFITYPDLKGGIVDLADIAFMNDCLDLDAENEALIAKWRADNDGR